MVVRLNGARSFPKMDAAPKPHRSLRALSSAKNWRLNCPIAMSQSITHLHEWIQFYLLVCRILNERTEKFKVKVRNRSAILRALMSARSVEIQTVRFCRVELSTRATRCSGLNHVVIFWPFCAPRKASKTLSEATSTREFTPRWCLTRLLFNAIFS